LRYNKKRFIYLISPPKIESNFFKDLNEAFNCPVIEAYGMTEATHQMTSNPLPPKQQKAGFVP